jgi:signal recognition particle subunit SRP54
MIPGMPDYLIPQNGDDESTTRLKKFLYMMDSMTAKELDGKVDFHSKEPHVASRIRRIAAGSGTDPREVKMLLTVHKQFEGMVSQMGKSGVLGKGAQARQQQMAAQMRKNPALIQQRLNQMDPRMIQQMGGREAVQNMMQQMAKGGGAGGAGGGGGGMPNMDALAGMMGGMGGGGGMPGMGGGGMPGMGGGGMPGQMPAGMPQMPPGMNMEQVMRMAQSMGMGGGGGGGMPGMGGGMPNMEQQR